MNSPKRVPATRVCHHCKRRKPRTAFFRNAVASYGLRPECKECTGRKRQERIARHGS